MKIAIISDTHDNLANFKKAIDLIKKERIKFLIHCGDIFEPETIKDALKDFSGKAHFVLSDVDEDYFKNIDENYFKNFSNLKIWQKFGEIEILKKKIAFTHFPKTAFKLAFSKKYDIVFYGHLHKPCEMKFRGVKLVNPGNLAGIFFRASFAIYDTKTDKLELNLV
jgi:putative phosphoesterase